MRGFGRDIFWAYAVNLSRVASWVVVYGTVYRLIGAEAAALLALVRWTLGLLNYASAGLAPAILHHAARTEKGTGAFFPPEEERAKKGTGAVLLHYAPNSLSAPNSALRTVYTTGITLSWLGASIGLAALWAWCLTQGRVRGVAPLVGLFGTGMLIDMAADAWGAVAQSRRRIAADYQAQTTLETLFAILASLATWQHQHLHVSWQTAVGGSYLAAAIIASAIRALRAHRILRGLPRDSDDRANSRIARQLLSFGALVVLAQIADYLYAPTDFLLIRWLIDLKTIAIYAPAVQIDAGVFLLVSGLSTALLPISAAAFGRGEHHQVRRYYILGTLISLGLLILVAVGAYFAAPAIFKLWLGSKMNPTRQILPLVLIHTVIGGSSQVGRSVLLAIGKVRAFTAGVLIAGVANVILSYCFVKYCDLGLVGIILGTIVAVVARCAIWMPWYVLRVTRHAAPQASS
ncbi:MAG TPA: MATE family efflux transporter [Tepidisphaeraceae bacterium]